MATICLTNYKIYHFCPPTGIEIDDFVEISSQLVQPLEEFFNRVSVMVVCYLTCHLHERTYVTLEVNIY